MLFLTPELTGICDGNHKHEGGSSFETYLSSVIPLMRGEGVLRQAQQPGGQEIPGQLLRPWCLVHGLTVLLVKKALPVSGREAANRLIDEVLEDM